MGHALDNLLSCVDIDSLIGLGLLNRFTVVSHELTRPLGPKLVG